ncbi:MAG: SGNH/GDSL hydrolase family protein [Gemmatimonadetes bacterium]|nr:SGNH/GDSL hydrolase family protein [Gemmatimonadota bacterium]
MTATPTQRFERYVAIGDSSTEGLDDPDGRGGFRGWANRLAERVASIQGSLLYANLGVRGLKTRQILDSQLEVALALRPNLATLFSGTNDIVTREFDPGRVAADVETMQTALVQQGATVLTFTLPDLTPVMPLARRLVPRVLALNEALRQASARSGAILVDVAQHPVASDPRLWSDDRLHANAEGHARIAAALGHALRLPGSDERWADPLPAVAPPTWLERAAAEVQWGRRYLVPWMWRHVRGRSSADGRTAKRPALEMVRPADARRP